MIIAELSVIPLGTGSTGVSRYVKEVFGVLEKEEGVSVKPGAMGSVLEAESLNDLFSAVGRAHEAVFKLGAMRVVTELRIDERRDKEASVEKKLEALK